MITDLFLSRFTHQIWWGDYPPPAISKLFVQANHVVLQDLAPALQLDQEFFRQAHDAVARELGVAALNYEREYSIRVSRVLLEPYDLWNDSHGVPDRFIKVRLSMIEVLFRLMEERVRSAQSGSRRSWFGSESSVGRRSPHEALLQGIQELNGRLRVSGIGLQYHAGLLQLANDAGVENAITAPCWDLLKDPKWASPERELKEAFDRAAHGREDAAFYAGKGLESTIKIISDLMGWTRGTERGAANYIDNLVSQKNGRFIATWEAELLKGFFSHVRNPHGHGSGSDKPPAMSSQQTDWAIESAMSWMKSLIQRLGATH